MQCWDHFRRWKGAPHGSKLFWRFGVSIFHVNNDRDIFGPGLCSMSFFLGYVFLKECSHWAVSWVRFFFSKLGRICLRIFFKSQPRWGWLQPPIKDNFNKVSIFFDCTRTLETKISFFFLQILSFMPRLVFAIPNTIGAYEPVLLRGSAGQAFLSTPALLQVPGQTNRNFGAQLLLGTAPFWEWIMLLDGTCFGMRYATNSSGWNNLCFEPSHFTRACKSKLRSVSWFKHVQFK